MKHFNIVNGKHHESITFHIFSSTTLCLYNVENYEYHVTCFQNGNSMFDVS